jgi:hypothetical protein
MTSEGPKSGLVWISGHKIVSNQRKYIIITHSYLRDNAIRPKRYVELLAHL